MDFDAGLIPADIVAALGLEWGPTYRLQNIGTGGRYSSAPRRLLRP